YGRALSQAEIKADMNTPLPGPVASLAPATLDFASQAVNLQSAPQIVTVSNTGAAPLSVGGITITGTGAPSYRQTTTCGAQLAPGGTCAANVTFAPVSAGTRTATLSVDGVTAATSLIGIGTNPGLTVTPATATLTPTETRQFTASSRGVRWSVDGVVGGSAATGTISSSG